MIGLIAGVIGWFAGCFALALIYKGLTGKWPPNL